jgi:DNA-binding MarR family transcriptional regulator
MAAKDDELESLEHELAIFLRKARAFSAEAAQMIHPDLEGEAYGLLIRIEQMTEIRASDLASFFGVGKPTIGRQLTSLQEHGLIERRVSESDRRAQIVTLSEDGRQRLTEVRHSRRRLFRSYLESWTEEDIAQLGRSLKRLNSIERETAPKE